jgi:hypothetical protein
VHRYYDDDDDSGDDDSGDGDDGARRIAVGCSTLSTRGGGGVGKRE